MTIRELAKYLDVDFNDNDPNGDVLVDGRLLERIKFLLSEFNESHFVIDDDEPIQVIADLEPRDTDSALAVICLHQGFVSRWREQNQETANVIPMEIHPKIVERHRRMDEIFDYFEKQGA
jgi:ERCC4-type nuclease